MSNNNEIHNAVHSLFAGVQPVDPNAPVVPIKVKTKNNEPSKEDYQKISLTVRKELYSRMQVLAVNRDKFVWQLFEEALKDYLSDK